MKSMTKNLCVIKIIIRNPRWQLERGSKQREHCKPKIVLRSWSHTWQKKTAQKKQNSDTLNPQLYKASPHHITLRNQEVSHTARPRLKPAWEMQTNR
jgi:hypothetical protein